MPASISDTGKSPAAGMLKLAPRLDLPAAPALLDALKGHVARPIVIDAGEVTHLGALCVQTLLAAARDAKAGGSHLELRNLSDRAVGQLATLGLTPEAISEGAP